VLRETILTLLGFKFGFLTNPTGWLTMSCSAVPVTSLPSGHTCSISVPWPQKCSESSFQNRLRGTLGHSSPTSPLWGNNRGQNFCDCFLFLWNKPNSHSSQISERYRKQKYLMNWKLLYNSTLMRSQPLVLSKKIDPSHQEAHLSCLKTQASSPPIYSFKTLHGASPCQTLSTGKCYHSEKYRKRSLPSPEVSG
jgi:hypothetical protein